MNKIYDSDHFNSCWKSNIKLFNYFTIAETIKIIVFILSQFIRILIAFQSFRASISPEGERFTCFYSEI